MHFFDFFCCVCRHIDEILCFRGGSSGMAVLACLCITSLIAGCVLSELGVFVDWFTRAGWDDWFGFSDAP